MRALTPFAAVGTLLVGPLVAQSTVSVEYSGFIPAPAGFVTAGPFINAQDSDSVSVSFDVQLPAVSSTATSSTYTIVQSSFSMNIGGATDVASAPGVLVFSIDPNDLGPQADIPMSAGTSVGAVFPAFLSSDFNPTSPDITQNIGSFTSTQTFAFTGVVDNVGSNLPIAYDGLSIEVPAGPGTVYCDPAAPNSVSATGAALTATGSSTAATNDLTLDASSLPSGSFGFFIVSPTQGLVMNPGGSAGHLCLSGSIGRYVGPGQIQQANASGSISLALDLTMIPSPSGFSSAASGDTLNFQAWYRDVAPSGGSTSNFTNGVEVVFD